MATFTVTNTNDAGAGSLRDAVAQANANTSAGGDTILFDASVFNGEAEDIIRLTTGQITITGALTIDGGAGVTISGDRLGDDATLAGGITDLAATPLDRLDDNSRIFFVPAPPDGSVSGLRLEGLTLTGGRTTGPDQNGGALLMERGRLGLRDVTIAGNSTAGAGSEGGGLSVTRPGADTALDLDNVTIWGNRTEGASAEGGGLFVGAGGANIGSTTITGNTTAGAYGGGFFVGYGGLAQRPPTVSLFSSIVLGNSANGANGPEFAVDPRASVTFSGGNIVGDGAGGANVLSGGYDVGDTTAAAVFAQTATRGGVVGGVIGQNGGQIATVALRADATNPAIDSSIANFPDARGAAPFDFPGAGTGGPQRDLGAFEVRPLEAASLVVTTATDVVNPFDNLTSLREAVAFAETLTTAATVTFNAALAGQTLTLTRGQIAAGVVALTIDGDLNDDGVADITIDANGDGDGNAATSVAADGTAAVSDDARAFRFTDGGARGAVTLDGLVITGGAASRGGAVQVDDLGGGVDMTLTIRNSRFENNAAASGPGGAVDVLEGDLLVEDTVFTGNVAARAGGGVHVINNGAAEIVTIRRSLFEDNRARDGGGLYVNDSDILVRVEDSSFIGNDATGSGGGLTLAAAAGSALVNVTVAGNTAATRGGGAVLRGPDLTVESSTITGNEAAEAGAVYGNFGARLTFSNSIVAGNASTDGGPSIGGYVGSSFNTAILLSGGGNAFGDAAANLPFAGAADLTGVGAAELFRDTGEVGTTGVTGGVAADNGGPVPTVALKDDRTNPALDGATASAAGADARGVAAVDLPGVGAGLRDIGAFELEALTETPSLVVTTEADVVDAFDTLTSLREAVAFANAQAGADTVSFAAGVTFVRLTQGQIAVTGELTVDGGAGVTITGDAAGDDATLPGGITDLAATTADRLDDNSRIFDAGNVALTLDSLTLTGGVAAAGGGGAARSGGALTLIDATVAGNATTGFLGNGGGVAAGGLLTLTRSTVAGNRTEGDFAFGGGASGDTATITDSTVSGNLTAGYRANGGGVSAFSGVTLTNATIHGNATTGAQADGGGVATSNIGAIAAVNSTVTANRATGDQSEGGGLFSGTNALTLTDSIVLGNVANAADGDEVSAGSLTLTGGVILGNGAGGADVFSAGTDVGDTTAAAVFAATVDNAGVAAGALADNGGPVATVALKASGLNPALDAAQGGTVAADARGVAAVDVPGAGAAGTGAAVRDLGAYELDASAEAGSLVVTTDADVTDAFDGLTSLREAVAFANATAGADTVSFAPGVTLIRLTQGEIAITDAAGLTIAGGVGVTISGDALGDDDTLDGGITDLEATAADRLDDNARMFDATAGDLTLNGLTLTGGRTTAIGPDGGDGGAVRAAGALTLTGVTVAGNETTGEGADGGGVFARGAVTLIGATISDNRTAGEEASGGGVYGDAAVTLTDSLVAGNRTTGDFADGGGVIARGALTVTDSVVTGNATSGQFSFGGGLRGDEAVTLTRSTVADNETTGLVGKGGGIAARSLIATDSTISGNATAGRSSFGGGVYARETATLTNVTVADNSTAGLYGEGGGILSAGSATLISSTVTGNRTTGEQAVGAGVFATELVTLTDSIVLGNVATASTGDEVGVYSGAYYTGTVALTGGTILGRDGGGGLADVFLDGLDVGDAAAAAVFAATVDNAGVVAGALADNGGPVRTVALRLAADNPALGLALAGGPATDARGAARDALPDAGAFEAANPAPVARDDAATVDEDAAVAIDVLANDMDVNGGLDPTSVRIEGAPGDGRSLVVAGEGVWTVDPATGAIAFAPEPDHDGPATDIAYTVADALGARSDPATVSVAIAPQPEGTITFQYLVAREITGVGPVFYRTAEFSGVRNDVAFEDLVFDPHPDPARIGDVLVGGTKATASREFFAVLNDGGDVGVLDAGDRLYRVSNAGGGDRLTTIPQTNQSQDVVNIRAAGVVNNKALGDLNGGIRFGDCGFGLDNGPDGEGGARWLNRGDTLVFRLTGADGASDDLDVASFTVRTDRASADIGFDADRDGKLLSDTNGLGRGGFVEDGGDVFLRGLTDGTLVEVDFGERAVRVDGVASTADFGGLFDDPGRIGLGASLNGGRWAIDDLSLGLA